MIIQSLCEYYDILSSNPDSRITKYGYKVENIRYILDLSLEGELISIHEFEKGKGKKQIFNTGGRSGSGCIPYILHDKAKYVFGKELNKNKELIDHPKFLESFLEKNKEVFTGIENERLEAVFAFLEKVQNGENWEVIYDEHPIYKSGIIVFRVEGEFVHEVEDIKIAFEKSLKLSENIELETCMISGEKAEISPVHNKVKGIFGGQPSGTALVSFNGAAYRSYGKEQNHNAPISKTAADKYVTALNYLIQSKENRRNIGDTTVVFWAIGKAEENPMEIMFGSEYSKDKKKQEDINHKLEQKTAALLERFKSGMEVCEVETDNSRVYILGLAPNNARVSVQFYYSNSYDYFISRIAKYHNETQLIKKDSYRRYIYYYDLLKSISTNDDTKNIHNSLKASLFYSLANGTYYPKSIYIKAVERVKAELSKDQGYRFATQVAFIKAYLLRNTSYTEGELNMALNENLNSKPYILGRIFAVLESVQYSANGSSNIRERYFQSASTNPKVVFGSMLNLYTHHLQKLSEGHKINVEKQVQELIYKIDELPSTMSLEEQGVFILGYYHQRQANFDEANKNKKKANGGEKDAE